MSREYPGWQRVRFANHRRGPRMPNLNDPDRFLGDAASKRRMRDREPLQVQSGTPESFLLRHIASPNNLMVAWMSLAAYGGQTPGVDGISFDISPSMAWQVVRDLSQRVISGTYRPNPTRIVRIPRPGRSDRVIEIPVIADRVMGKAVASALKPMYEPTLTRFYNAGRENVFSRMKVEAEANSRFYIAQDDIQNCYPTANRETVMDIIRRDSHRWCVTHLPEEEHGLIELIQTIVAGPADDSSSTGLIQGGTLSPLLTEIMLNTIVDAAFHTASSTTTILHRYVDDICVQGQNPSDVNNGMELIRSAVQQNGQQLKGSNAEARDLRTNSPSNQPLLGLLPTWEREELTFTLPDSTWQHLTETLEEIPLLAEPRRIATAKLTGWINSISPCIRRSNQDAIRNRITGILNECQIHPEREPNIPKLLRLAAEKWQNLTIHTQNQLRHTNT